MQKYQFNLKDVDMQTEEADKSTEVVIVILSASKNMCEWQTDFRMYTEEFC